MKTDHPAEKLLKRAKLSVTRQRVAVLELFLAVQHPMTPHEVHQELEHREEEPCDPVTVYRVLEALTRKELLTQVPSTDRHSYFCLSDRLQGMHAHQYCPQCRSMRCVESPLPIPSEPKIAHMHVVLSGTCAQCDETSA